MITTGSRLYKMLRRLLKLTLRKPLILLIAIEAAIFSLLLSDRARLARMAIAQVGESTASDPLIDEGGRTTIYIGIGILAIAVVFAIGAISHKIEQALLFAVVLAALIIIAAIFI